jgi:twitching motility protein PilT
VETQIDLNEQPIAPPGENGEYTRPLTPTYKAVLGDIPDELEGSGRIAEIVRRMQHIPPKDIAVARTYYRGLIEKMISLNASDLDMGGPACQEHVWYRVDGAKRAYPEMGKLTLEESDMILLSVLTQEQREQLLVRHSVDFGYTLVIEETQTTRRFRTTVYSDNQWLGVCSRMLAWKPRSLGSLGFHPLIERGMMFRYVRDGLTIFTGVTGSGKSTSLDAIIDANNMDFQGHILIVAQPLEYIHDSKKCIVRQREVGVDVDNFIDGMVQGLRQDPDIVVVGEMRNPETISTAMEMSDTGHKVFSTLHTGSAVETIDRVIAEYSSDEQERVRHRLADVLRCVVSQKLLPQEGGGRVLAKEVLWMTPSARAAIKNKNTGEVYQMMWEGKEQGMHTLEQDLLRLVRDGDVTAKTALSHANNKRRLLQLLR